MRRPGPSDSDMWCTQPLTAVVTEYDDQYIHTSAHEVLEACKQLSSKETSVGRKHLQLMSTTQS